MPRLLRPVDREIPGPAGASLTSPPVTHCQARGRTSVEKTSTGATRSIPARTLPEIAHWMLNRLAIKPISNVPRIVPMPMHWERTPIILPRISGGAASKSDCALHGAEARLPHSTNR